MANRRGGGSGGRLSHHVLIFRVSHRHLGVASYHVAKLVSEGRCEIRPERQVIGAGRVEINRGRPSRRHTPRALVTLILAEMDPYS